MIDELVKEGGAAGLFRAARGRRTNPAYARGGVTTLVGAPAK